MISLSNFLFISLSVVTGMFIYKGIESLLKRYGVIEQGQGAQPLAREQQTTQTPPSNQIPITKRKIDSNYESAYHSTSTPRVQSSRNEPTTKRTPSVLSSISSLHVKDSKYTTSERIKTFLEGIFGRKSSADYFSFYNSGKGGILFENNNLEKNITELKNTLNQTDFNGTVIDKSNSAQIQLMQILVFFGRNCTEESAKKFLKNINFGNFISTGTDRGHGNLILAFIMIFEHPQYEFLTPQAREAWEKFYNREIPNNGTDLGAEEFLQFLQNNPGNILRK